MRRHHHKSEKRCGPSGIEPLSTPASLADDQTGEEADAEEANRPSPVEGLAGTARGRVGGHDVNEAGRDDPPPRNLDQPRDITGRSNNRSSAHKRCVLARGSVRNISEPVLRNEFRVNGIIWRQTSVRS